LQHPDTPPEILIESVEVDGTRVGLTGNAQLAAETRRIEVSFTAIELAYPTRTKFRYRLDGLDERWIEVGNQRSAEIVGLGAGEYRFMVSASLNDGPWNPRPAAFEFRIARPWMRHPLFLAACVAFLVATVFAFVRSRMAILSARADAAQARNQIARELHDTLAQSFSGALLRLEVALRLVPSSADRLREQLRIAQREIRASFESMRGVVAQLRDDPNQRLMLRELLERRVRERLSGTGVTLEVLHSGPPIVLPPVVTHHLCRVVDEAVSNALLHAASPALALVIDADEHCMSIKVKDFGSSHTPTDLPLEGSAHHGLRGMRERANEIGAALDIDATATGGWQVRISLEHSNGRQAQGRHAQR
jgi:signal transduction histidine kinase